MTEASAARLGARYAVPSGWQVATLAERRPETPTAATLVLDVPGWPGHEPGQHLDLRLTAPDGYTAERSYSLAGAGAGAGDGDGGPARGGPSGVGRVEVTVQRVMDGEVSTYLVDEFPVGSSIEVRGPVGGWFVWDPVRDAGAPVLAVAGGSGVVPLMAMLRARTAHGDRTPFRLIYSVRTPDDQLYAEELDMLTARDDGVEARTVFTRAVSLTALRGPRRLTASELTSWGWPPGLDPRVFVCGPTGFVEAITRMLVADGHDPARIRTERFGPATD